jgi:methylthioribulose-1-phosphate dehydratase
MRALLASEHYLSLQKELLAVIHWFHQRNWSPATSTNYSFRNPIPYETTYTISRSGVDKAGFGAEDFMLIDTEGTSLEGYKHIKPSAETLLHTMLYERTENQAILHTHSIPSTVTSIIHAKDKAITLQGFEVLKGLHGIQTHEAEVVVPIFANSQDIKALSEEIGAYYAANPSMLGFLLVGHGLYAWGSSIAEAKRHTEVFEYIFECLNVMRGFK